LKNIQGGINSKAPMDGWRNGKENITTNTASGESDGKWRK